MEMKQNPYWGGLFAYLKPQKGRMLLLTMLLLGGIGLQLLTPRALGLFIDRASQGASLQILFQIALAFIGLALLARLGAVAATYFSEQVGWAATNQMRNDLARHCLKLDMPFHAARSPGMLIERIEGDVTALSNFFSAFVILVLGNALLLIGVLALLFLEDWRAGLTLTFYVVITMLLLTYLRTPMRQAMLAEQESRAQMAGFLEERFIGLEDIRANGAGGHGLVGFFRRMQTVYQQGRRAAMMRARIWGTVVGVFGVGSALALGVGAYLYSLQVISIGTVFMFFNYAQLLQEPLQKLTVQMQDFHKAGACIARVQALFAERSAVVDGAREDLPPGPLAVAFADVSFSYAPPKLTLDRVSFRLSPGKTLGLLGRTASGKTTLTRLLVRLYDPNAGHILIGGVDSTTLRLSALRRHIGLVTQDVQLLQASLRDNLTLFGPATADAQILQALRELGLWDWYQSLPSGLDTELAPGGSGLSAGEGQLLSLARVFLKNPGLVILDEASARVDPATEQLIKQAVSRLLQNRTGIIIAHRLTTVEQVDEIMILEHGALLEYGSRTALMKNPASCFARLLQAGIEEALQ